MKKKKILFGTVTGLTMLSLSILGYLNRKKISAKIDDIRFWHSLRSEPEVEGD